jgi:hypothetical protein
MGNTMSSIGVSLQPFTMGFGVMMGSTIIGVTAFFLLILFSTQSMFFHNL